MAAPRDARAFFVVPEQRVRMARNVKESFYPPSTHLARSSLNTEVMATLRPLWPRMFP